MSYQEIIYEQENELAIITFNRPNIRNALNYHAIDEALEAAVDADADDGVRVIILTGAGDRAFCTGGDQSIRGVGGYEGTTAILPLEVIWQQVTQLIRSIPKPVIARVNGYAIGGGLEITMACDFIQFFKLISHILIISCTTSHVIRVTPPRHFFNVISNAEIIPRSFNSQKFKLFRLPNGFYSGN